MLTPGGPFPDLSVALLEGSQWSLAKSPYQLALINIIRGHFCTYCHDSVIDLDRFADQFHAIGIDVLTTSTDTPEAARKMVRDLNLERSHIGSGMSEIDIRRLGLYATARNGTIFAEPAILIAKRSGEVYAVFQNSISCGRTDIARLLEGLQLLAPAGFPLRGNA